MTCVVGIQEDDRVYIGADSLGSTDVMSTVREDKKVFKLQDANAVVGFSASYRMGQLLMYAPGLLNNYHEQINHRFLVSKFIPRVIDLFDKNGFTQKDNEVKSGGFFLLGYENKLYKIESDFQVGINSIGYNATGSGESLAMASLYSTSKSELSSVERIHIALQAATELTPWVRGPFYIMNTKDDEIIKFEK